jgi:purine-nucleoside phosphorylase
LTAPYSAEAANRAADVVRNRVGDAKPEIAIILGSGLGGLADEIEDAARISFVDIPGLPAPTVVGHAGELVSGQLGGKQVVALAGRVHMYEGNPAPLAAFPVRILHALGADILFASNAAGGINPDLAAGDLMMIVDHLNLTFTNPLIGPVQDGDERFPDMSEAYDFALRQWLRSASETVGVPLKEGVYACLNGPSFETPAEVKMLATLGADAVGMSTVPEVIVARAMGMRVAAISCISNAATGTSEFPVLHKDVLDVTAGVAKSFQSLIRAFVEKLPPAK